MSWKFELLMKPEGELITEGPVWTGEDILFTHIRKSRILRYNFKSGEISEWRTGTNRTNGLCFDAHGQLFGCCSGGRRGQWIRRGGIVTVQGWRSTQARSSGSAELAPGRQVA